MSLFRRFDRWRPSLTWWALGGVLIVFAVADIFNLGNYNREITILGVISFLGMVLELAQKQRSKAGRAHHE